MTAHPSLKHAINITGTTTGRLPCAAPNQSAPPSEGPTLQETVALAAAAAKNYAGTWEGSLADRQKGLEELNRTLNDAFDKMLAETAELEKQLEKVQDRYVHKTDWYHSRFETLSRWGREKLQEPQLTEFFNILANCSASPLESPVYLSAVRAADFRANVAESRVAQLERELAAFKSK